MKDSDLRQDRAARGLPLDYKCPIREPGGLHAVPIPGERMYGGKVMAVASSTASPISYFIVEREKNYYAIFRFMATNGSTILVQTSNTYLCALRMMADLTY